MTSTEPTTEVERQRDPVCGMNVRVDVALSEGLVAEHDGHTYYFCRGRCRDEFVQEPNRFIASHPMPLSRHRPAHPKSTTA